MGGRGMSGMDMGQMDKAGGVAPSTPSKRLEWVKPEVRTEEMSDALTGGSNFLNVDGGSSCGS